MVISNLCIICRAPLPPGRVGSATCGPTCHEELVAWFEREVGTHKRVTRMTTGETFMVPVRDIIEKGVREEDLDQYPREPS
ncbi:MAG: hypothetical protein Q8R28_09510 [Dehalococcoidia bacterium]|nr:hypothetical protein [Dehalococcoidia bacterium]